MKAKINVLVTGANGQLGLSLKDESPHYPDINFLFLRASELDITNKQQVSSTIKGGDFDYCINCAAYTDVELAESEVDKTFAVNYEGLKNLVDSIKSQKTTLIHISTDYVFDGKKTRPYKENDKPNPINVYGKSKLAGEIYIQDNLKDYFIIRTSWLYSRYGKNFLKTVLSKMRLNEHMHVTSAQKGTPTSCEDLSKFLIQIMNSRTKLFGIYHYCAQGWTNWYEFAKFIVQSTDDTKTALIHPSNAYAYKAIRPVNSRLDNTKSTKFYGEIGPWKNSVLQTIKLLEDKQL